MPINFQQLQQASQPKILGALPSQGQSDSGIDSLMGGLTDLIGVVKGFGQSSYSNPQTSGATSANIPGLQSGVQPAQSQFGLNKPNIQTPDQAAQGMMPQTLNAPSMLDGANQNTNLFNTAMKQYGLKEGNPVLSQYLQKANPDLNPTTTPWCAGFVGSVLNSSGLKGTGSLSAKSYLNYGVPTQKPSQGDIVVLNRGNDPSLGHVGFFAGYDNSGNVKILGGNQDNSVSIKSFPSTMVAGFRSPPSGREVQAFAQQNNIQNPGQLANMTNPQNQTLDIIKKFEGYSDKPYWDVNAHRAGYGSDTTTLADGRVVKIKQGMTVTREDSERDLARRTQEFQNTAMKQVGQEVWNKLPPNAQAGLTSVAYNYGSLPKRIIPAVKSGDINMIGEAVRGLAGDNKGVNKSRRNQEADIIISPIGSQQTLNDANTPIQRTPPVQPGFPPRPNTQLASNTRLDGINSRLKSEQYSNMPIQGPSTNSNTPTVGEEYMSNYLGQQDPNGSQQASNKGINWQLLQALVNKQGNGSQSA
jgi:uncharacterized protein (TIGR02594 family)